MRIIIDNRDFDSTQRPLVTIDTHTCTYPYAIRNAIELALKLDGYDEATIKEVFGIMPDICCEKKPLNQNRMKELLEEFIEWARECGEDVFYIFEFKDEAIEKFMKEKETFKSE